jgi:ADP-ribosylglycohydrolase
MKRSVGDRVRGAIYGAAIGDALGAAVEFMDARQIAREGSVLGFRKSMTWEVGEWTDDTDLLLATSTAYEGGKFDPMCAVRAMVKWLRTDPKDVGNTTRMALEIASGAIETPSALSAGMQVYSQIGEDAAGNGSLMRIASVACARAPTHKSIVAETDVLSKITHVDLRCVDACRRFVLLLSCLIHGENVKQAFSFADGALVRDAGTRVIMRQIAMKRPTIYKDTDGIGFVLLCFERAIRAVWDARDYASAVLKVVNMGGDADTNAAVAGALLGARFGFSSIPTPWVNGLRTRSVLDDAVARLEAVR